MIRTKIQTECQNKKCGQKLNTEPQSERYDPKSHSLCCRRCSFSFENSRELYLHGMRQHYQVGGALQARPWSDDNAPWIRDGEDERLREVYEERTVDFSASSFPAGECTFRWCVCVCYDFEAMLQPVKDRPIELLSRMDSKARAH